MAYDTTVPNVTEETQKLIDEFLMHYNTPNTYGGMIKRISSEFEVYDFRKLSMNHYEILMKRYHDSEMNSRVVKSLFRFLYSNDWLAEEEKFLPLYADKETVKEYFVKLKSKRNKAVLLDEKKGPVLSFQQIEKLIEYCNTVGGASDFTSYRNLRMAFAFYLLFFEGVSREVLTQVQIEDYVDGNIIIGDEFIEVPEKFVSIFEYAQRCKKNDKYGQLNPYIKSLGQIVGIDNLMPKDITMSRKEYLFTCPACRKEYLSFYENWKIINGKIVCLECAEELISLDLKKNETCEWVNVDVDLILEEEKEKIFQFTSTYEELKGKLRHPCDFEEWNKYLKQIGDLGEKFVYEREIQKLLDVGKVELAEKVDSSIAADNKNGFDILSYTVEGKKLHIEVKATPGPLETPFYMSRNEITKAKKLLDSNERYVIHRVYNVGKDDIEVRIYSLSDLEFEEHVYKVNIMNT